jgi:hypothetical protein
LAHAGGAYHLGARNATIELIRDNRPHRTRQPPGAFAIPTFVSILFLSAKYGLLCGKQTAGRAANAVPGTNRAGMSSPTNGRPARLSYQAAEHQPMRFPQPRAPALQPGKRTRSIVPACV